MMDKLKFLNKKETNKILEMLEQQYGFGEDPGMVFLKSQKEKVYAVNKEIGDIDLSKLRINSVGLYLGEISGSEIRLSIEGSQLIGLKSSRNVLELNFDEQIRWLKGQDLDRNEENGFWIIRHEDDFMGCGRMKEGKLLNYVPKTRRLALTGEYF